MTTLSIDTVQEKLEMLAGYDRTTLERAKVTELREKARGVIPDVKNLRKADLVEAIWNATASLREVSSTPLVNSGETLAERTENLWADLLAIAPLGEVAYRKAFQTVHGSWQYWLLSNFAPSTQKSNLTYVKKVLTGHANDYEGRSKALVLETVNQFLEAYSAWAFNIIREVNKDYHTRVAETNKNQTRLVGLSDFYQHCLDILKEPYVRKWYEVSAALALVTGRRAAEIHCSGEFTQTTEFDPEKPEMTFSGQLKQKDRSDKIDHLTIPVLAPSADIIQGVQALIATNKRFSDPGFVNSRTAKTLSEYLKTVCLKTSEGDPVTYKDLRAIYGAICVELYKPDNQSDNGYLSTILGHSAGDIKTASSYQKFTVSATLASLKAD